MKKLLFALLLFFSNLVSAETLYFVPQGPDKIMVTISDKACTDPKVLEFIGKLPEEVRKVLTKWQDGNLLWTDGEHYKICWAYSGGYIYALDNEGSPIGPIPAAAFKTTKPVDGI